MPLCSVCQTTQFVWFFMRMYGMLVNVKSNMKNNTVEDKVMGRTDEVRRTGLGPLQDVPQKMAIQCGCRKHSVLLMSYTECATYKTFAQIYSSHTHTHPSKLPTWRRRRRIVFQKATASNRRYQIIILNCCVYCLCSFVLSPAALYRFHQAAITLGSSAFMNAITNLNSKHIHTNLHLTYALHVLQVAITLLNKLSS